mmetsp:Transcript_32888/g.40392  ORF Transcript_32888/g.40392 Transcript_32888/m.40392 type:complete len:231 (+) Transcript_32888:298-990(+)
MTHQRTNESEDGKFNGAGSVTKNVEDVIGKEWYFWTIHGESFMGSGATNPILTTKAGECNKFRIVPVGPGGIQNGTIAEVAIEHTSNNGKKTYISCHRPFFVTNSCLAQYRKNIGTFETFIMTYYEIDNSFIFQSHNDYYLHYNETFHTVAFKTCSEREDGFPMKGRWELLGTNEMNWLGTKNAVTTIPYQMIVFPVKTALEFGDCQTTTTYDDESLDYVESFYSSSSDY